MKNTDAMPNQPCLTQGATKMQLAPEGMRRQLIGKLVSEKELRVETKSIYSSLKLLEAKCIHVDNAQAAAIRSTENGEPKSADSHWKALFAMHRSLIHEHHDFLLATQHPSASPTLQHLPAKHNMPERMWKHGIHSFLELLRYRLPYTLDYMIGFICLAYQMIALLFEIIPKFADKWTEYLGDLGRLRMAMEEDDDDRETWAEVVSFWNKAAGP